MDHARTVPSSSPANRTRPSAEKWRWFARAPRPGQSVLELGCGDGTHLIASAVGLPDATFVGRDLSATAVERGNRLIAELGLRNACLHAADVTTWVPPHPFDYAIAHGLYSWVPPAVRDAVLKLYANALAPAGVGYVSYNIYPGCYVRRMLWEMMRFHTADIADPVAKMTEATEFAKFLAAGGQGAKTDSAVALMTHELESVIDSRDPRVLYHDDLGAFNDPVYVSLQLELLVCVLPGHFRSDVQAGLLAVLGSRPLPDGGTGLFHPDKLSFGQTVYLSQIYAAARQVAGVGSVNATVFQRQGIAAPQYLQDGFMRLARLEIPRLDNDANFPEHGLLRIHPFGGL